MPNSLELEVPEINSAVAGLLDVFVSSDIDCSIKEIPAQIGNRSLVGIIISTYPFNFGNYFSFYPDDTYCLNMWAENLDEWLKRKPMSMIKILEIRDTNRKFCLVIDPRVPADWINTKLCYTGCMVMSDEMKAIVTPYC